MNFLAPDAFEGASVVEKTGVIGYRRKKDLFILLVEAFSGDEDKAGLFVVKIGTKDVLKGEIEGWNPLPPARTETRPCVPQPASA